MEKATNIKELFEELSKSNLTLKSFITIGGNNSLFDLDRKGRDFAYPAWLLKDIDDGSFGADWGNLDKQIVTFFLVDKVDKQHTVDDIKREMKLQLKIILARLFKIRKQYTFLENFNPNKAQYFGIGPITGDIYGMGCTFSVDEVISMIDQPDQWQS